MGNTCCHKPDEESVLKTLENNKREAEKKKDKYPHDSDSGFKSIRSGVKKIDIKQMQNGNIIEE